jgi:anti-sigma factor RsiW
MIGHDEAVELLGAYALDAVEPEEAAAVEAHLETCPRCRAELQSHREVVGVLAYAGGEAPAGMWDRVAARIHEGAEEPPPAVPIGRLSGRIPGSGPDRGIGPGRGLGRGRRGWGRRGRGRRGWGRRVALPAVAAAAVVAVVGLGVEVAHLQQRTNRLSTQIASMSGAPTMADVRRALVTPGERSISLAPAGGGEATLDGVLLPGGQGYLYDSKLAPLAATSTYQLWGVVGDQRISYGLLGVAPASVTAFRASAGVQALAVTVEVAGGAVTPSQTPVAAGAVG